MKLLYRTAHLLFLLQLFASCNGQTTAGNNSNITAAAKQGLVGGPCDGCELMFVDMPANINAIDTSSGWAGEGQKLLVRGTIYKKDGKTPAPNVILYYWQTGNDGMYTPKEGMNERAKRHGHMRGWIKTGTNGRYAIYTIRPMPYPNTANPSHIHLSIKEPDIANEYYLDDLVFDDDPFLTAAIRKGHDNRGGSGILKVQQQNGVQVAEHNIILGLNVPNYPSQKNP